MRSTHFVVLSFGVAYGVSFEAGQAVSDEFSRQGADWWVFAGPDSFIVYFAGDRDGAARADRCRAALEPIRSRHECLRELTCGRAEGSLIATFDWRGRVTEMPLGIVTNEAMQRRG